MDILDRYVKTNKKMYIEKKLSMGGHLTLAERLGSTVLELNEYAFKYGVDCLKEPEKPKKISKMTIEEMNKQYLETGKIEEEEQPIVSADVLEQELANLKAEKMKIEYEKEISRLKKEIQEIKDINNHGI